MKRLINLVLYSVCVVWGVPASAHTYHQCKFQVVFDCMKGATGNLNTGVCNALAEARCIGHSHGGGGTVKPGSNTFSSASGGSPTGQIQVQPRQLKKIQ